MATHSSVLAWRIPWMEKPGRLQSMGSQESDTTEQLEREREREREREAEGPLYLISIFQNSPFTIQLL